MTAGGKKVVPGVLEERLRRDPLVQEVVCVGDGRPFIAALVVVAPGALRAVLPPAAAAAGDDVAAWCRHPAVRALYAGRIAAAQRDQDHYARIRRFALLPEPFTEAGGELTPTLKVKRTVVAKAHARTIDLLYREGGTVVDGEGDVGG